jgi:hypothetical protein
VGSNRRARRHERAQEFGARHPRLAVILVSPLLAAVIALYGYQLSYGTYLGRGWVIAALAGTMTAVGLNAAVLISNRRHSPATDRFVMALLLLALPSASAIKFPFPQGPYGKVQAFFNVVHAAMLGFEAVTVTAILALMAYAVLRLRARARSQAARGRHALGRAGLPARLRFPGAQGATWRAGRLIAANDTVTWLSRNGDAEVDLTSACQALPMLPTDAHGRQPRETMLATADGLVEVDVSPRALVELVRSLRRPPYGDTVHPAAQD